MRLQSVTSHDSYCTFPIAALPDAEKKEVDEDDNDSDHDHDHDDHDDHDEHEEVHNESEPNHIDQSTDRG